MRDICIRPAALDDAAVIMQHENHLTLGETEDKIGRGEFIVAYDGKEFVGWIRYNLFWDLIPLMNMIKVSPEYRGEGIGAKMVGYWENKMRERGFDRVLTTTQQNENAQHFYNAVGYRAIGGFMLTGNVYDLVFEKIL